MGRVVAKGSSRSAALISGALLVAACSSTMGDEAVVGSTSTSSSGGGSSVSSSSGAGAEGGTDAGGAGAGGESGAPVDINNGWIGGPCEMDADCPFDGGFCLTDAEGFPQGMCALDCSQFCPDQDDAVQTFCATPEALGTTATEGLCTMRCDYGQSPTGCRAGYQCQVVARYSDADTEVYACVPGEDDPFPLGECHQELIDRGVAFTPAVNPDDSPPGQPGVTCVIDDPIIVSPYLAGVSFHPSSPDNDPASMFTGCKHALAMLGTAEVLASEGADALVHYGVYNCRTIAGSTTLSEHGRANALDIAGVQKDGNYWTVQFDWEKGVANPVTPAGQFLRQLVETLHADMIYNIILTPEYNADHYDHFHCDLTDGAYFLE